MPATLKSRVPHALLASVSSQAMRCQVPCRPSAACRPSGRRVPEQCQIHLQPLFLCAATVFVQLVRTTLTAATTTAATTARSHDGGRAMPQPACGGCRRHTQAATATASTGSSTREQPLVAVFAQTSAVIQSAAAIAQQQQQQQDIQSQGGTRQHTEQDAGADDTAVWPEATAGLAQMQRVRHGVCGRMRPRRAAASQLPQVVCERHPLGGGLRCSRWPWQSRWMRD
ncbi:hypothetical protein BC831DRAFT_220233 [Entophlyctis helioformis]|nr:hypothetical protein BC831DRAFT_220233 [Entophlyctis helioformis]